MNDSSSNIPDEEFNKKPQNSQSTPKEEPSDIFNDGIFTIKISEDMALRNALRSGLVEAQGRNTDRIPMFVSWPSWLDDGIVCFFAKDFHRVLHKAVQDTAVTFGKEFEVEGMDEEALASIEEEILEIEPLPEIKRKMQHEKVLDETPVDAGQEPEQQEAEISEEHETIPEKEPEKTPANEKYLEQDMADQLFKDLREDEEK